MKNKQNSPTAKRHSDEHVEDEQIEQQLKDVMKNFNIRPSEDFKKRSYQTSLHGIEKARRKVNRHRRFNHLKHVFASVGLVAVVVLLVFQLVNSQNDPSDPSELGQMPFEDQPSSDVQLPDHNETDHPMDRPEMKEIIVYPEGMKESRTFQLLSHPALPFTTYIPQNYRSELIESVGASGVRIEPTGQDFAHMFIQFFTSGTTEQEAFQHFEDVAQNLSVTDAYGFDETTPQWVIRAYAKDDSPGTHLFLGKDNDYYFYVYTYISHPEVLDGWAIVEETIYQEWRWNESGDPLTQE